MPPRNYRLGRRQESVERTRIAILAAARELLLAPGERAISAAGVAERAGVSRLTIYNRFGSMAGLLREVAGNAQRRFPTGRPAQAADAREQLHERIAGSCSTWSSDPALFRRLSAMDHLELEAAAADRALAERLLASDQLRPGCSLKEAEDVIGAITSFGVFDRLHREGRRSATAVTEILMRMGSAILRDPTPASQGWPGSPRP
jgi:AcrR family transcriptional regulator